MQVSQGSYAPQHPLSTEEQTWRHFPYIYVKTSGIPGNLFIPRRMSKQNNLQSTWQEIRLFIKDIHLIFTQSSERQQMH